MSHPDPFAVARHRLELLDANQVCLLLVAAKMIQRQRMPTLPMPVLHLCKSGLIENYWTRAGR